MSLEDLEPLFRPLSIRGMPLRNRLVMVRPRQWPGHDRR